MIFVFCVLSKRFLDMLASLTLLSRPSNSSLLVHSKVVSSANRKLVSLLPPIVIPSWFSSSTQYTPHDVFRRNVVQPWWYHAALPHSTLDFEPISVSVSRSDHRFLFFVQIRYQLDNVDRESHLLHRVPQLPMAYTVKCLRIINETHIYNGIFWSRHFSIIILILTICSLVPFPSTKPACSSAISLS